MKKLGQWVTDTFRARRADGTTVIVEEVTIKVQDPTSTGTIWNAPPTSYTVFRLADGGGEVDDLGDGNLVVSTGERLTRV